MKSEVWTSCKLGDVISVKHGYAFKGVYFSSAGHYLVLTPGNFEEKGGFKYTPGKEKFYAAPPPKEYICSEGDLIVAMTEQAEGLLGSTALVPESEKFLHNQRIGLIVHDPLKVDKLFLYFLFATRSVRQQIKGSSSGTKVKHTSPERISDVSVSLPPLPLQQRIGKMLFSLEHKIAVNNRISALVEEHIKLLYDYWFLQLDFPNKEGNPYTTAGGSLKRNEVLKRDLPSEWTYGNLSDIAHITMGQSPPGTSYNDTGEGAIFYQGSTDFGKRYPEIRLFTTKPSRHASKGDILLSVRAPVGDINIANTDCCIGRGLSALRSKHGSQAYLYCVMQEFKHAFSRRNGDGTTFGAINKNDLHSLPIALPPLSLIDRFEKIVGPMFDEQNKLAEENQYLHELRQWLIPLLFSGRVTVTDTSSHASKAPELAAQI